MPKQNNIQFRRGTNSEWDAQSTGILSVGEPGYISDFNKLKIGDGSTQWSDLTAINDNITTLVINKTLNTIPKMSVVYINGAQGDLPSVTLSLASGESSSSKTYGITTSSIAPNAVGQVVVDGALKNLNTLSEFSGVAPGTTLWLSPTVSGGITINKPYAPYHTVSLGNLIRVHQTQGVINVSIQNGFELAELHNVAVTGATNGQFLQYNSASGLWLASSSGSFTSLQLNGTGVVASTGGTAGYLSKFIGSNTIDNSLIYDDGNNVGIGTTTPSGRLHVVGTGLFTNIDINNSIITGQGALTVNGGIVTQGSFVRSSTFSIYGDNNTKIYKADGSTLNYSVSSSGYKHSLGYDLTGNHTSWMTINNTGVGIGTTTPSGTLDVRGSSYFGSTGIANNLYLRTGQAGISETVLRLRTDTSSNLYLDASNAYVKVGNQSADVDIAAGNAGIRIGNNSAQTLANQNIRFVPANTEVMRITPTGVGIGTTSPSSQLHVIGSGIFTSGINIANQTASTIASFDANKNIISLSTSTYPSLTELSYVKGTTSSIQNQLNSSTIVRTTGNQTITGNKTFSNTTTTLFEDGSYVSYGMSTPEYAVDILTDSFPWVFRARDLNNGTEFSVGNPTNMDNDITISTIDDIHINYSTIAFNGQTLFQAAIGAGSNGQLLIGNGSSFSYSTLTAGTGIGITNGSGAITIAVTGIPSSLITNFNSSVSGLLPTIANSGDNRILTSTGSSVGINAESDLTFDGTNLSAPRIIATQASADEGGELQLAKAPNSSISGAVIIDTYQNRLRFFEQSGSNRGFYLDLSAAGAGASTNIGAGGGGSGTTVSNYADNRIITSDGTTTGLNAETNFTFNGNLLSITGSGSFSNNVTTSGSFIAGSGNAANPSFEFVGDADTGMFSTAANTIGLATSGIERLRIDSIGNVGIGTAAPSAKLDIAGTLKVNGDPISNEGGILDIGQNSIGISTYSGPLTIESSTAGDGTITIGNGYNDTTNLNSTYTSINGNVGIGIASPTEKLEIDGIFKSTGFKSYGTSWFGSSDGSVGIAANTNPSGTFGSSSAFAAFQGFNDAVSSYNPICFTTLYEAQLYLNTNGNVGIGTATPSYNLDVNGTIGDSTNPNISIQGLSITDNSPSNIAIDGGANGLVLAGDGTITISSIVDQQVDINSNVDISGNLSFNNNTSLSESELISIINSKNIYMWSNYT